MESVWIALIVAVVTSTISPALLLVLKSKSDRIQRLEDAEFKRQERLAVEAREDAREARAEASRALMRDGLETVKKQTDGMMTQVAALARSEGAQAATAKASDTAATLALGQQQGRDAERESIAAKITATSEVPLPVLDNRTAVASERVADATERSADAAQRVANIAEEKKGD